MTTPHKDEPRDHAKGEPESRVLEASGTKPVDAPDPMSDADKHPQVVVNPELDPADNKVKLTERNVDPPTPQDQREGDLRQAQAGGGHGDDKRDAKADAEATEAAAAEAKRKADATLLNAEAGYGGRSGQIAARLRALNVPVVRAEDIGDTGVRLTIDSRTGGAPLIYEAADADANADFFIGRMRLAGYIV